MVWHNEGRLSLVIHSEMNPTNQEWLAFLNALSAAGLSDRRIVVYTRGGTPNGGQRKQMEATFRHSPKVPIALITGSAIVRAVGVIVTFFSPLLRAFSPADEQRAFEYLGLTFAEQQYARSKYATLGGSLAAASRVTPHFT